jgi:heat shock protein HtpX
MKYVGIATQQARNNRKSVMLLACFPLLVFVLLYIGCFIAHYTLGNIDFSQERHPYFNAAVVIVFLRTIAPYYSAAAVIVLFAISIFAYTKQKHMLAFLFALMACLISIVLFPHLFPILLSLFPRLLIVTILWIIIAYIVDTHVVTFVIILALSYISCFALAAIKSNPGVFLLANDSFFKLLPCVALGILAWFIAAYFYNADIIDKVTGAYALERRENKRVYNLVENLCISCGMEMPQIHILDSSALNAFASGVSSRSYTITLTRGIIDELDDKELEGVIAHELTHIRNNDVRVLMVSIVFVGIFDLLMESAVFMLRQRISDARVILLVLLVLLLAPIGYGISLFMRSAISRSREYMADAGAAELTRDPRSLASALRKISENSFLFGIQKEVVAQLFIEHSSEEGFFAVFYKTHPPIKLRIAMLEQF